MRHLLTTLATAAAIMQFSPAATARPFTDPRSDRSDSIDQAAALARDCRGDLADISLAQFRQYKVTITCTDHEVPELTNVWPGQDVTITCIPGLGASNTTGDVLIILAKVTKWNTSRDEWAAETAWQLEAEQRAIS